jgi:hypothetical protein
MEISEARKLRALEEDNRKLKKLLADSMLDVSTRSNWRTFGFLRWPFQLALKLR